MKNESKYMTSIFCNDIRVKKRFIKCISEKDNKCYLFIGKNSYIRGIVFKIKANYLKKKDFFNGINDDMIDKLYYYLYGETTDDMDDKVEYIMNEMYLNYEDIEFIEEQMNEDDTNEIILNKLANYCYPDENITSQYTDIFNDINLTILGSIPLNGINTSHIWSRE